MLNDNDGPMTGLLEHPGVSYTVQGSGDDDSMTLVIRFVDEAIDSLAGRFQCAPDACVIMGEIVDGLRRVFGHDVVSVKRVLDGKGRSWASNPARQ